MLSLQSPAEPVLQPDPENVAHVMQVAAHQVEPAVGIVAPADGQLLNPVAEAPRNRQNLHVEHVAVDLLPPEQLLGHRVLEELEPALRVLDAREADYRMHKPAESHAPDAAVKRLRPFDEGAAAPRPDRHIDTRGQQWTKLVEIVDGYLVVRVGIADDLAGSDGHRLADAEPLAAPRGSAGGLQRRIGLRRFADDFPRAVGAIRGYDNLVAPAAALEIA